MTEWSAGTHTAIVTGANHGIGETTAVALGRRGNPAAPAGLGTSHTARTGAGSNMWAVVLRCRGDGGR